MHEGTAEFVIILSTETWTQLLSHIPAEGNYSLSPAQEQLLHCQGLVWANEYFFHLLREIPSNLIFIETGKKEVLAFFQENLKGDLSLQSKILLLETLFLYRPSTHLSLPEMGSTIEAPLFLLIPPILTNVLFGDRKVILIFEDLNVYQQKESPKMS